MKHMTLTEIKQLLREIPDYRQRLAVLIGFWHGLRNSEILALKGVHLRHGYVNVKRLKGSFATTQRHQSHPDPELDEATMIAKLDLKDDESLISMTRSGLLKLVKRAARRAGIPEGPRYKSKHCVHALKHSCAMVTIPAGIEIARQRLGHKSLSSTGAYLRVSDDTASDAIDALLGVTNAG